MEGLSTQPVADDLERRQLHAELQAKMFGHHDRIELGPYVLVKRLGSGAMGVIYIAQDTRLGRQVALKVLHPDRHEADADGGHLRLRHEARTLGQVTHPNVVEVYDVGVDDGRAYIAMELVHGGSLEEWLTGRPRSWRSIVAVFIQAARGLWAAHQAGVMHRDFKPGNVLVGSDGRVRVVDFGLARPTRTPQVTEDGAPTIDDSGVTAFVGTPRYMAPAQLLGAPADASSDQYALCVALFEGLFGEPPFDPKRMLGTKQTAENAKLRPAAAVPLRIQRAIRRGLSPDPRQRHRSMLELLEALDPRPRYLLWAVAAVAIATSGVALAVLMRPVPPTPPSADAQTGVPSPETVREVAEVATELAKVRGLLAAQAFQQAETITAAALERAEQLGDGPLLAKAGLWHGTTLASTERLHEAVAALEAAYSEAVASRQDAIQAEIAVALARIHIQEFQDIDAGERWIRDAATLVDAQGGPPKLQFNLAQLAVIAAMARGQPEVAVAAAQRGVASARASGGDEGRNVAFALQALGTVLFQLQRFEAARVALGEAIPLAEKSLGAGHVLVAQCLGVMAAVDAMDAAASGGGAILLQRAVATSRRAAAAFEAALGPDHYETVIARMNLGIVLAEAGNNTEAAAELQDAMDRIEALRGPNNPGVGVAAENLGLLQLADGELELAEASLQRAVLIIEVTRGVQYPALATTLSHLGEVQLRRGHVALARKTYQRAVEIGPAAGPGSYAAALGGIAALEESAGHGRLAAELFERSADAWAEALGPDSARVDDARAFAARARAAPAQASTGG